MVTWNGLIFAVAFAMLVLAIVAFNTKDRPQVAIFRSRRSEDEGLEVILLDPRHAQGSISSVGKSTVPVQRSIPLQGLPLARHQDPLFCLTLMLLSVCLSSLVPPAVLCRWLAS